MSENRAMESPLKIQPKVGPLPKPPTPLPDKQQLLNKGLKLPTAVVQPQVLQHSAKPSPPPPAPAPKQLKQNPPTSPGGCLSSKDEIDRERSVLSPVIIGRKRKRNNNDDLSVVEKEKK